MWRNTQKNLRFFDLNPRVDIFEISNFQVEFDDGDAGINCECENIESDSRDAMGSLVALMMFATVSLVPVFVRREEENLGKKTIEYSQITMRSMCE